MSSPAVRVEGISKSFRLYRERAMSLKERVVSRRKSLYEEFWALKDLDLEIMPATTAGLVGANGSGKTTLLKIIAGIIRPTEGKVTTRGRIASLLELGAGFHPDLTGRENVYLNASILGLTRRETERFFDDMVGFAELEDFIDTQVRHYSSGMYVRLGFAVAVHVDPDILIVDEVLAVGDEAFQRRCLERIRNFQKDGRTIVFVTHAVDMVREICTRAFLLEHGRLVQAGHPTEVVDTYRRHIHGGDPEVEGSTDERGSGEIRLHDVQVVDSTGQPRQVFTPGEPLEIRGVMKPSRGPVDDPVATIVVTDDSGRYLWGTNTMYRDLQLGRIEGDRRFAWRIPSLPVMNVTCSVTLALGTRDGKEYHWRDKGWAFKIVNPGSDVGFVSFDGQFSMDQ
jgi:ABC-2 type transport system ATP-binding protein